MQRASICLAVLCCLCGADVLCAADAGITAVFTNKVRFRIPFRYDAAEMQRLQAREVQLFVSTDQGGHWKLVDKVNPQGDHFDFQAPADGEYWFAVRTLDSVNRLHPQGNSFEPGLKVIVDATPPVLELTLVELEPGKVELRWTAADDHLDATKLRIEYRQPNSSDWQQVGIVPQPSGQTNWTVPAGGAVAVRGSISDSAGNKAEAEKELSVHSAERGLQKDSATEYRAPVAASEKPAGPSTNLTDSDHDIFSDQPPDAPGKETATSRPTEANAKADQNSFGDDSGPIIRPRVRNNLVSDTAALRPAIIKPARPAQKPRHVITEQPVKDQSGFDDFAPAASAATSPKKAELTNNPVSKRKAPIAPPTDDGFVDLPTAAPQTVRDDQSFGKQEGLNEQPVPGPKTILVNNRTFQIGYRVDDVGPSGVGNVELFITQDGGRKWYRYGVDADKQSPFAVTVPSDGVYGFELRVKNGAGIGDDPPRSGDAPSIVVAVDKTPPTVELLPPQVGRGNSRNKILLRWKAEDVHLGAKPILLEFAPQSTGPWKPILDWQANAGRTIWSLEPGLPGKVFLRLTVKDDAGNTTQVTAPPVVIDLARPTARIVDIEAQASGQPKN